MKFKNLFIALLLVTSIPAAAAMNEEAIRAAIENQVNQRHPSLPAGFWEGLGSDALPVLKKMYEESESANEKGFLIDGLAHFSGPGVSSFLETAVKSTENEVLKKKLLSAVIQSEGESAFNFVEPYLNDDDGHIRTTVARGLMAFEQNEQIKKRLESFRKQETTPWVLAELKKGASPELQRTRKQIEANPAKNAEATKTPEGFKPVPPLPEKSWAGIWRGAYVTDDKMLLVEANLILVDAVSAPLKWKVEFKLPKQVKQEWKTGEFTLHYFQTNRAHWIEIRNSKMDIVFLAQRKVK